MEEVEHNGLPGSMTIIRNLWSSLNHLTQDYGAAGMYLRLDFYLDFDLKRVHFLRKMMDPWIRIWITTRAGTLRLSCGTLARVKASLAPSLSSSKVRRKWLKLSEDARGKQWSRFHEILRRRNRQQSTFMAQRTSI